MEILLGHLVGDYLLQNRAMALNKNKKGINGLYWCTVHCLLYTMAVCSALALKTMTLTSITPMVIILVFVSHWPIDRWSLANYWIKLIGSKTIKESFHTYDRFRHVNITFSCIIYTVSDNTIHLILLWVIYKSVVLAGP